MISYEEFKAMFLIENCTFFNGFSVVKKENNRYIAKKRSKGESFEELRFKSLKRCYRTVRDFKEVHHEYVLLNILGVPRWAERVEGGFNVDEMFHKGTWYMAYHKTSGHIIWDVDEMGRHPTEEEFEALEASL